MKQATSLTLEVGFDDSVTGVEAVAHALDQLLATALSTPGVLSDYGYVTIGDFTPIEIIEGSQFVKEIEVTDPDSQAPIELEVWKTPQGGMFALDSAFLDQAAIDADDETEDVLIPSPFDLGIMLRLPYPQTTENE